MTVAIRSPTASTAVPPASTRAWRRSFSRPHVCNDNPHSESQFRVGTSDPTIQAGHSPVRGLPPPLETDPGPATLATAA